MPNFNQTKFKERVKTLNRWNNSTKFNFNLKFVELFRQVAIHFNVNGVSLPPPTTAAVRKFSLDRDSWSTLITNANNFLFVWKQNPACCSSDSDRQSLNEFVKCIAISKIFEKNHLILTEKPITKRKLLVSEHRFKKSLVNLKQNLSTKEMCPDHGLVFRTCGALYKHLLAKHPELRIENQSLNIKAEAIANDETSTMLINS